MPRLPDDPQVRSVLARAAKSKRPLLYKLSPDAARVEARAMSAAAAGPPVDMAEVRDIAVPGPGGDLPARVYRPLGTPDAPLPVLVYFHGGGWVIGDLDSHDGLCRRLAAGAGCLVFSIGYRLAPEQRFPAAVEDAAAALAWAAANAAGWGGDGARLALGGDSAGGNLVAVASRIARDSGGPPIRYQLLIYPVTDLTLSQPSYTRLGEGFLLGHAGMEWYAGHYLGGADPRDPMASPLFAADLAGLPPALIVTAGFDPLADEGAAYGDRLEDAGVAVARLHYDDMIHGFLTMDGLIDQAGRAAAEIAARLGAALARA
ncbi:MAG: alpha/beta hydrolase [Alphaproteobacteria bacterium]